MYWARLRMQLSRLLPTLTISTLPLVSVATLSALISSIGS